MTNGNLCKDLIALWEQESKIEDILDDFIFFLKKDGKLYGAPEESRLIFSKLKKPDKEMPKNWKKEAMFSVSDLTELMKGNETKKMFGFDDMKSVKVVDREEAEKELRNV